MKFQSRAIIALLTLLTSLSAMVQAASQPQASAAALPGMVFPGTDWQESAPEAQGVDSAKLNNAMSYLASQSGSQGTSQALVAVNGYLIWNGSNIDQAHNVWSMTKSFTSTVLGLLIDDGEVSLDSKASSFVPSLAGQYPAMTMRQLTTMTSGYSASGGDQSSTPFTPAAPLFPPGAKYQYWDSAMNQYARVLTVIAGEPIQTFFKRRIADPIGMDSAAWSWGNWGTVDGLLINGGAGNKSKGISISAREVARLGHLFLNRGNWNGQQLISASWVDQATTVQVPASTPANTAGDLGPGVYGFNWWVNGVKPDGKRLWPSAPPKAYLATGFNNNRMWVVPEWNMVIVRLGTDGSVLDHAEIDVFLGKMAEAVSGAPSPTSTAPPGPTNTPAPTPSNTPPPGQIFADVPASHPYHVEIEALYQAGYTAGCAEDPLLYCPDQQMNRAESAVYVVRGVHGTGADPADPRSSPFADLTAADWALNWANQLYQDGYTAGCGTNPLVYCPWAGHTRAEGAVFYLRMLHGVSYEPPAPAGIFDDVVSGIWYEKWVEAAYEAGILPACGQNPLQACPEAPLDRGLAAYMLYQAKDLEP